MKIYSVFDPEFKPYGQIVTGMEDTVQEILTARNKWLLAHPDSTEAKGGAKVGLSGENIDIANFI